MTSNLDHQIKLQNDKEFYDVYQKSEWSFKTVEFNLNETKTVTVDNGQVYEVPQPGIGVHGSWGYHRLRSWYIETCA